MIKQHAPPYITKLSSLKPLGSLRFSEKSLVSLLRTKSSLSDGAFSVSDPKLFNPLPTDISQATPLKRFKA